MEEDRKAIGATRFFCSLVLGLGLAIGVFLGFTLRPATKIQAANNSFTVQGSERLYSPPDIMPGDWIYGLTSNDQASQGHIGEITGIDDHGVRLKFAPPQIEVHFRNYDWVQGQVPHMLW